MGTSVPDLRGLPSRAALAGRDWRDATRKPGWDDKVRRVLGVLFSLASARLGGRERKPGRRHPRITARRGSNREEGVVAAAQRGPASPSMPPKIRSWRDRDNADRVHRAGRRQLGREGILRNQSPRGPARALGERMEILHSRGLPRVRVSTCGRFRTTTSRRWRGSGSKAGGWSGLRTRRTRRADRVPRTGRR